jgi:hypothetical protein
MRTSTLILALCLCGACAYPRRSTLSSPAPVSANPQDQPDQLWSIHFVDAQLPESKGGGLAWDSDGTPPDPFVRLVINGRIIWQSPVQKNTLHPVWNVTLPRNISVPRSATFRIELWDEDAATADPAGVIVRSGLPETALPGALAHLSLDNLGTVTVVVSDPKPWRGVGVEFEQHSDALVVLSVEPFSPAARAGIRTGERIVAIGTQRVSSLSGPKAVSELSLSGDRGGILTLADKNGKEHEITLDHDYLWLTM